MAVQSSLRETDRQGEWMDGGRMVYHAKYLTLIDQWAVQVSELLEKHCLGDKQLGLLSEITVRL